MYKIGISGKAKSGKDTILSLMLRHLQIDHEKYVVDAFARPMKEIITLMIPWAEKECLYGSSELRQKEIGHGYKDHHNNPLTYRQVLLDLGDLGRKYHSDFWINTLLPNYMSAVKNNLSAYFTTDVRFENELSTLRENGFYLIRVKRNTNFILDHKSDTGQDDIPDMYFDHIIDNNKSLIELDKEIQILTSIIKDKFAA